MSDNKTEKPNYTPYIIAGVAGLAFVGFQKTEELGAERLAATHGLFAVSRAIDVFSNLF